MRYLKPACAITALFLGATAPVLAGRPQTAAPPAAATSGDEAAQSPYILEEVMVPMRDGAKLQTVILRPRNQHGPLPILFSRTPYGVNLTPPRSVPKNWAALDRDGYIYVDQSMRGRFKSDGVFTLSTAVHPNDPKAIDEATDAYDAIDWLVKNVPENNGKVGMWGVSYPGFAAAVALAHPHPALKAVSPQAAWIDYWQSDDLHRNGALRLSYATDWIYSLQHRKDDNTAFNYDSYDTYDWFLKTGPVENIDKYYFKGSIPMFTSLLDHPDHDGFYTGQRWSDALGKTVVPTLNVAGYWDQEDPSGSWQIYFKQKQNDPDHLSMMVSGPWQPRLLAAPRRQSRADPLWRPERAAIPGADRGAVLRLLAPRQGHPSRFRGEEFPERQLGVEELQSLAAGRSQGDRPLSPGGWLAILHSADRSGDEVPRLCVGSRQPRAVPPAADVGHLSQPRLAMVGGRGPALPRRPARCTQLCRQAAHRERHGDRQRPRAVEGRDQRDRQRFRREADRRVSGRLCDEPGTARARRLCQVAQRLSAPDRHGRPPRPLPRQRHGAATAGAEQGDRLGCPLARTRSCLPQGPPDHGAGPVDLVPGDRPQSAKFIPNIGTGPRERLRQGDAEGLYPIGVLPGAW